MDLRVFFVRFILFFNCCVMFAIPFGMFIIYGKGVGYLTSPGRPTDIGFQLGKACYPCSS